MGLLQYINLHYYSKTSLQQGLLKLAEKYLDNSNTAIFESFILDKPFYQFHTFSKNLGSCKTALFVPHHNKYSILFSHNLDNVSIQKSVSSYDFWCGMLHSGAWFSFTGTALSSFSQFFSESDRENIYSIYARWLTIGSKKCIFLIAAPNISKPLEYNYIDELIPSLVSDLHKTVDTYMPDSCLQNDSFNDIKGFIDEGMKVFSKVHCFEFSINSILNSPVLSKNEKKYLLFELFCRMKFATVKPNICFLSNEHTLRLVLFSHEEIDSDMYQMYMKQNLEKYFLPETLEGFSITSKGVLNSSIEIQNFILSGV